MKKTEEYLLDFGIKPNIKGFFYICDAVDIIIADNGIRTGELYEEIAMRRETTNSKVERAIRHAFQKIDFERETTRMFFTERSCNGAMLKTLALKIGGLHEGTN